MIFIDFNLDVRADRTGGGNSKISAIKAYDLPGDTPTIDVVAVLAV